MAVRGQIKKRRGRAVTLAACTALSLAWPAQAQLVALPLAQRIDQAAQAAIGADKPAAVARYAALQEAAARDKALDAAHRVTAERLLAQGLVAADRLDEARAAIARGQALAETSALTRSGEMAWLLSTQADLEYMAGGAAAALPLAREADALLVALYGQHSAARSVNLGVLGRIVYRLGMQREAHDYYLEATREEGTGRAGEAYVETLVGLAQSLSAMGEEEASIATYYRAREAAGRLISPDDMGIGMIESELAVHLANEFHLAEALPVARSAVDFFRRTEGAVAFDTGAALKNYGYALGKSGRHEEAERMLSEALTIFANPKIRVRQLGVQADAYDLLGQVQRDTGRLEESLATFDAGLKLLEQGKKIPVLAGYLAIAKAESLAIMGRWPKALAAAQLAQSLQLTDVPLYSFFRVRIEMLNALALTRLGRGEEGWAKALPVARAMEERLADPHLAPRARAGFQAIYRGAFERFVDIAVSTGHEEDAFRAAQLASLSELSVSGQALAARVVAGDQRAGDWARKVQQQQERLAMLERERNFATARKARNAAELSEAAATAGRELDEALAELRQVYPHYFEVALPKPVSLAQARRGLARGQALLLPVQSNDRLNVLVVTARGLKVTSAPLARPAMTGAVRALRARLEAGEAADSQAAWTLGGALFSAATLAALQGVREVSVLGSGALMTLPLGMLLTAPPKSGDARAQPYALRRFAFSVRPLLGDAAGKAAAGSQAFLGIGAPVLGPVRLAMGESSALMRGGMGDVAGLRRLPSLPQAQAELAAISSALQASGNLVLAGEAATEQAVRGQKLERFGVLAFATHGLVSGQLGALSEPALVLTPPETAQASENDGLLTASEIAGLRLDANWVILSACNTGSGLDHGAGGYSGLARGFMQAGARNLLVSLWPVRDDVAAKLSVATVKRHAAGLSRAQALRRAMLAVIADKSIADGGNPAVWAPFSLVAQ